MDNDLREDLISDLPQSIIETILTKLPIRDAVRTCALSSKWRYKWTTITDLVFNDKCVSSCYDRPILENKLVSFITHFLFLHDGPIHKFALSTSFLQSSPDIDQWLLFLSRRGIRNLSIELGEGEWFRAPSCLFTCSKLTHLELVRCELDPPPKFKGFLCLKYLNLQQILMPPDDIEYLISSCPLLESLTLSYFDGLELALHAPNLKYLILEGEFMDICLENTPRLIAVSIAMYITDDIAEHFEQSSSCNFDKFLGGVPCLERLVGQIYFTKYLSIGIDSGSTPIKYHHLKIIELYQVNFEDLNEVLAVLRLIVSSPNLKELHIAGPSNTAAAVVGSDLGFWEKECPTDYMFDQLKTVKITEVSGTLHEMGFIKFLLEHAPVLKVMTITPSAYVTEGRLSMLVNLVRFRRASAQAEVIFVQEQP
ncbi:F-box/FBD/LRR-repeat protein At1g13570 isoform X2 [Coffea eugenioides]|uniref:F-box/FBD/LRR-repeat protein At1g13570 n=1 Tax=Coffea arabica TaxID=13443 RepID=A0A6P6V3X8_COFAR|nr:F-box/FBD/LRR-repeat protein At1g13570 [Coffea arabica]XP_027096598.1 F-box/FBD/LRR-repeat protein At1g13570 [Coffea arabica]XP_027153511.1 F-box/FBD/LRR-repeat protein At1g13570 isoform X1 [Coffea eugenioides]XP_027153512.1 F-box/FBD/LRR-repeat protein At1g13570 isoform X2 [Coffea eugenioides]